MWNDPAKCQSAQHDEERFAEEPESVVLADIQRVPHSGDVRHGAQREKESRFRRVGQPSSSGAAQESAEGHGKHSEPDPGEEKPFAGVRKLKERIEARDSGSIVRKKLSAP